MFLVSQGKLDVLGADETTILATLGPGSYFGEISILNMGNVGNRRTASVRSIGYSDLFCLSKEDLWDVLSDYPSAKRKLEKVAFDRLSACRSPVQSSENCFGKTFALKHLFFMIVISLKTANFTINVNGTAKLIKLCFILHKYEWLLVHFE